MFLTVFTVSTLYYGLLGTWYWIEFKGGWFIGSNWLSEIYLLPTIYITVFIVVAVVTMYKDRTFEPISNFNMTYIESGWTKKTINVLLLIGLFSSLYVYLKASALSDSSLITIDPFLLIFYQFSDVLIAVILFSFGTERARKNTWKVALLMFLLYAIFTGLRYKIALIIGPLLLAFYFNEDANKKQKVGLFISLIIVGIFFSVMTVVRSKFSGLDLDAIKYIDLETLLYGLFADANSVFGLASTLSQYGNDLPFVHFKPLIEVFEQFVPRFIYPDKNLYSHLKDIAYGISMSEESLRSGTTVPFFGEYFTMFGWYAVYIGSVLYVFLTIWLFKLVSKYSLNPRQLLIGVGLISVYMGYYYYSRGSMAQIFKGLIFIVYPYIILLRMQRINLKFK
ncbi:hypothetical protein [Pseudoalteromonas sp. 10-33]|uniref:hypothetical protein n=1 Tax=Pseudoalteromonas sp. 10-33 TaxID=1761890 RepID=UPI000731F4DA|nr:hypothetical protein [Pseudoalteromonas sp. 10-33]KTF18948.1 hypothetical protein ATS76_13640 [Pseudoalteromonas sp. 10-33]